jgi:hypothetical protein
MKIKITIMLLTVFIAANFLYSQPKDVKGFLKTTWGMTEQQIIDAMKDDVVKLKSKKDFRVTGAYATLGMKKYSIDSNDYIVYFVMDGKTNLLKQVNLEMIFQKVEDNSKSYDQVRDALEKEYGKATKDTTGYSVPGEKAIAGLKKVMKDSIKLVAPKQKTPFRKAIWITPSTVMFLIYWGQGYEKSMIQFFQNDPNRNYMENFGFVPKNETDESKEEAKPEIKKENK